MSKFNLKKHAEKNETNLDRLLEETNDFKDVSDKNLNLSISKKENDATIPFEKQLEASRKEHKPTITEKSLNNEPKLFNDKRIEAKNKNVMSINLETKKHEQKAEQQFKDFNKKVASDKDTKFWDEYVDVAWSDVHEATKIPNQNFKSQLQNKDDRFNKIDDANKAEYEKMVTASLKDADALLFHIFAIAKKEGREINAQEKEMIQSINSKKARVLTAQFDDDFGGFDSYNDYFDGNDFDNYNANEADDYRNEGLDGGDDEGLTIVLTKRGRARVYDENDDMVDEFNSLEEAQEAYQYAYYAEGEIEEDDDMNDGYDAQLEQITEGLSPLDLSSRQRRLKEDLDRDYGEYNGPDYDPTEDRERE